MKRFLLCVNVFLLSGSIFASEGSLEKIRRMSDAEIKGRAEALINAAVKSKKIGEFTQLLKHALELKTDVWYPIFSGIILKLDFKDELSLQKIKYVVEEFTRRIADPALQLSPRIVTDFVDFLNARKELDAVGLCKVLQDRKSSALTSPAKGKTPTRSHSEKAMSPTFNSEIADVLEKRRKSMEALRKRDEELPQTSKKVEEEKQIEKEHEESRVGESKAEEAHKAEEARKVAEQERKRKEVETKRLEEENRAAELKAAEGRKRQVEEARKQIEETTRLEEERQAAGRRAEEERKRKENEEARQRREAEAKRLEEAELKAAEEPRQQEDVAHKRAEDRRAEAAPAAEAGGALEVAQNNENVRHLDRIKTDMVGIVTRLSQLEIENLLARAEKCYLEGDKDEAHNCFMRIQATETRLPQAIKMRALAWLINCHRERKQPFDCFQSPFDCHPTLQAQAYAWVGVLYYKAKQYEVAKSAFENVLTLWTTGGPNADPEAAALAWAYHGDLLFKDKEYAKAKKYLEWAAKQRDSVEARQFAMSMLGKFSYYGHGKFRCNIL